MLFLKQFRLQFLSFIKNDFSGVESGNTIPDNQTPQNAHDLITQILSDGRLDGEDLNDIKSLKDIIESEVSEIYSESREGLNSLILDTLNNGYSVSNENDYLVLLKMLKISNSDLKLPANYNSLVNSLGVNNFSLTLNHQGNGFYVFNQDSSYKGKLGFILGGNLSLKSGIIRDSSGNNNQIGSLDDNLLSSLRSSQERLEQERLEQERLEQERLEQERLEQERLEQERLEQERLEQERLEQERLEQERLEQERLEQERLEQESLEQERLEQERLEQERLEQQSFSTAKRFYERMGANKFSIEGLQAALILNGEELPKFGADGSFGKETYDAVKSFQMKKGLNIDGIAGDITLSLLGINEKSKDFYSITSSSEVGTSENLELSDSVVSGEEVEVENGLGNLSDSLNEKFNSIKTWIKEIFSSNPVVGEFVGGNGRRIILNYVEGSNSIHVNTPFFDGISDFPLSDIPSTLSSKEDAELYVLSKIDEIKENYDSQVLFMAINRVSRERFNNDRNSNISSKIDNFDNDGKNIDISLVSRFDVSGNHKGYFLQVNTPFRDGVRDREVTIQLSDINDISDINIKSEELKNRYINLYNERNKK